MDRVRQMLRSGDWLTRERIRLVAVALLLASGAGLLFLAATSHGGVDLQGRPLGTDFADVYAAGTYVWDGNAAAAFDPVRQFARERAIFGDATQFYGWHYPPYFLFVAGALGLMPYGLALAAWQAATLTLYLLAMWAIVKIPSPERGGMARQRVGPEVAGPMTSSARQGGVNFFRQIMTPTRPPAAVDLRLSGGGQVARGMTSDWLVLALAFPAVLINIGHGQNGFLTAALFGGALAVLERRPSLAGILFGLLVYKPQYGLLLPLILAASGRWKCFAAAAATVVALTLATTLAFGMEVWPAFARASEFTRSVVLEQGNTGWYKIQSVFSWARMWGAPIALAYALQGVAIVAVGAALARLWRSAAPYPLKAAALCLGAILATPYSLDYDMMVLAPALAFFAVDGLARGFGPWEKTILSAVWLVPLVARSVAQATLIPLGVPAMLAMFIVILRRSGTLALPPAFIPQRGKTGAAIKTPTLKTP